MAGLDELFSFGTLSKEFSIGETTIRLNVLDATNLQDALNASHGADESAKFLDMKKNILARAITYSSGQKYISDPSNPTLDEIKAILEKLNKMHVTIINQLYDFYDKLDTEVKTKVDEEVKKSLTKVGAK